MIGNIVTITVNNPCGVDGEYPVLNETGVIVEIEEYEDGQKLFLINTGKVLTTWWFSESQFRPATEEEVREKLRYLLMKGM